MLSHLVLGRAMLEVAHIDLPAVAADRCARRGRRIRWLRRCLDIRTVFRREAQGALRPVLVQRGEMLKRP